MPVDAHLVVLGAMRPRPEAPAALHALQERTQAVRYHPHRVSLVLLGIFLLVVSLLAEVVLWVGIPMPQLLLAPCARRVSIVIVSLYRNVSHAQQDISHVLALQCALLARQARIIRQLHPEHVLIARQVNTVVALLRKHVQTVLLGSIQRRAAYQFAHLALLENTQDRLADFAILVLLVASLLRLGRPFAGAVRKEPTLNLSGVVSVRSAHRVFLPSIAEILCALHVQQVKQPPRLAQEAARHALQASMLEMMPVVLTVFLVLILLQELKHVLVVKQENISARVEQLLVLYVHLESIQG